MTRKRIGKIMTGFASVVMMSLATADEPNFHSLPPSVIVTVPKGGDLGVDASLKEIRVTFSKEMMTRQMWSWCIHSPETFPEITDKERIRYLPDKRTCVLPVKLEPGRVYALWINTQKHNAFRDKSGNPAVPYLLVFQTRTEKGASASERSSCSVFVEPRFVELSQKNLEEFGVDQLLTDDWPLTNQPIPVTD